MSEDDPDPRAFTSPEEFNDLMRHLSARMGYINRVAGGEKKFLGEVSRVLSNLGRGFEAHYNDKEFNAKFGDGWTQGTASPAEQRAMLIEMLLDKDRFTD